MKYVLLCLLVISVVLVGCQAPQAEKPRAQEKSRPLAKEKVDDIVIDDTDAGFACEGEWYSAWSSSDFKDGTMWSYGASTANSKAVFTPDIKLAGKYEVFEQHGDDPNFDHATNAPFTINYDGGSKTVLVNLQEKIGQWNSLGTFKFSAGKACNITETNKADGNVIADAIKLVYKGK